MAAWRGVGGGVIAATVLVLLASAAAGQALRGSGRSGGRSAEPVPLDDPAVDPAVAGAFFPQHAMIEMMRGRGFVATGLRPVYPSDARCPEANSFFADPTRGDGSARTARFFRGLHGGLDIPVPVGTPILAVADGTVIRLEEGRGIGGIGVILRHPPAATGLPAWTFTEYKHLREMPALELGQAVGMGDVIAFAGLSGTTGGYYGPAGHSHLHLSAWFNADGDYAAGRSFVPGDGQWMDPLAFFRGAPMASSEIVALPDADKAVPLPIRRGDGGFVPVATRVVWPLVCD